MLAEDYVIPAAWIKAAGDCLLQNHKTDSPHMG